MRAAPHTGTRSVLQMSAESILRQEDVGVVAGSASEANADPHRDPEWVSRVRAKLVDWYEQAHRELPWRVNRDPFHILVSEMMLVQTTVAAVVPFFQRFLSR